MKSKKVFGLKPSRLFILIILFASNTFAWFIYATKVDSNVSVHVRAWNIVFEAGENEVTNNVNVVVDSIYPGMENYNYELKAYNRSEVNANLSYQILRASILGTEYISKEEKRALGLEIDDENDLTSAELESKLANDYPFSIQVSTSSNVIQLENGIATYTFSVIWPYENNHDDIDTMWGSDAYTYKVNNPTAPSITLKVKIVITQSPN